MKQKQMMAIKLVEKCEAKDLMPILVERPTIKEGFVLIKVQAFGVNESEITSRRGESSADFSFPRILGIEGVGIVDEVTSNSRFKVGQKVATMMGGLGRSIDGSYAEYMLVREENIIPLDTNLDWDIVGALPEMLQTAYGSLTVGLGIKKGDVLLIRGGTSTVGLMALILAKKMGATVITTSRKTEKLESLRQYGSDYTLVDNQEIESEIKKITPQGVDMVLELVGLTTLFQDMSLTRKGGRVCFTGALSGQWTLDNFSPFMIPTGVFLTSYAGGARDLPSSIFNDILKSIENKEITVPIAKVYHGFGEVAQAQTNLESGKYIGKHVIIL
ncbi:zinc-binding dehydrogenase [Terribacillus saccharophilus]|uniref:zinc-binding dehydrogenase n=1 Tax=Terribacillus saccharophilus TaxID=361277 RepID=UPI003981D774